jgi:hypothetical protein
MNQRFPHIVLVWLLTIALIDISYAQFYTGSSQSFGQNRVQYNSFMWQSYDFEEFEIYFTASGKTNAIYTAKSAHKYLKKIEAKLDIEIEDKLQIIVYNTLSEFRQSNIGLTNDENSNIGGITQTIGEKLFVYFDGEHEHLDEQIKKGIAEIALNKIMFGNNWKDAIKSSTMLALPSWFREGLLAYLKQDWNTEIDNKVKDAIFSGKFENLNWLEGEDAELAGVALWNYIGSVYGEKMIPNIIYLTRISRNVESGFLFAIGASLNNISSNFVHYYSERYKVDNMSKQEIKLTDLEIKTKKRYTTYQQFKVSPDGKYASFVTYELGQYKVWLEELSTHKRKKIGKGSYRLDRIPDYTYPVTVWHPSSSTFVYSEEKKGNLTLNLYDVNTKKKESRNILRLQKILSMNYNPSGNKIVFSAVANGQTDIYLYNPIGNSQKRITNDLFDDLDPDFVSNGTQIIFSSNRNNDTIKNTKKPVIELNNYTKDLYIIDIDNPKELLQRITKTPFANESKPFEYSKGNYTYLSNENGITNRYRAFYDSTIRSIDTSINYRYFSVSEQLTNFDRSILEFNSSNRQKDYTYNIYKNGKHHFYKGSFDSDNPTNIDEVKFTHFMDATLRSNEALPPPRNKLKSEPIKTDPNAIDINNYQFDGDVQPEIEKIEVKFEEDKSPIKIIQPKLVNKDGDSVTFKLPRQELYKTNFSINKIVSQLDNAFLTPSYQRYDGGGYINPGFNELIQVGAADLFEDYRLIGGFRIPLNLSNTEYLVAFENLKRRLDKKYLASRRSFREVNQFDVRKIQTYEFKQALKYPFSEVASARFTSGLRYDRNITLSTEDVSLNTPTVNDYFAGVKLEYIFDNTRKKGLNILDGTRLKLWGEFNHQLDKRQTDFFVLGADIRHYQKIHRTFYWASRLATSTSFGNQKLLYYLGGVDNWLFANFDNSVIPSSSQGYQFQTIATPMRGFFQNTRNGNTFAVINNELRFPLVKYFSKKPIKSDFLENLMIIGFGDIGTAWTGTNPYDTENSFNTSVVSGANYEIILKSQKEPIAYGYGFGARSKLFGYYIRFDMAWGIDDNVRLKPVRYISLSLDF